MPNGASFSTPVQPIAFSTAQLVGPCSASAATSCVSSTIGDVEAVRGARQPVELPLLRAQPIVAFAQVKDRAVVDDLAVVVAPDAVADLARLDLRDVARDQPIEERQRIGPCDAVLRHRREVEHRAGVADRRVFERLVEVRIGGGVVLPPVPLVQLIQRRECADGKASGRPLSGNALCASCRALRAEDRLRRVAPGGTHDAATGMAAGAAQVQAVHGHRVLRRAGHRSQHQELIERELAVMPVAAGDAELPLDVRRQQQLGCDDLRRRPGA